MKVLGFVCSPRKDSNTGILVGEALASAREAGAEVEMVNIAGKNIAGCDACDSCKKTGKCRIKDDMREIYPKLLEADGIIFGTPVYFWGVTSQAKALMDRTYAVLHGRRLRNKIGGIVVVARRAGGSSTFSSVLEFINLHRMVPASNTVFSVEEDERQPEGRGGGVIAYAGERGEVVEDKKGMADAKALGRMIVRAIQRGEKGGLI